MPLWTAHHARSGASLVRADFEPAVLNTGEQHDQVVGRDRLPSAWGSICLSLSLPLTCLSLASHSTFTQVFLLRRTGSWHALFDSIAVSNHSVDGILLDVPRAPLILGNQPVGVSLLHMQVLHAATAGVFWLAARTHPPPRFSEQGQSGAVKE